MIRIRNIAYKILFGFIFLSIPFSTHAQLTIGAKGIGVGQATTALPSYEWAIFANPALADSERIAFGFYGLRNYGFPELTDISAFGSVPADFGVTSFGVLRYGDELFSETRVRTGYKNQWKNLHVGAVLNYNHIAFGEGYGSGGATGIDLGIAAEITDELWVGAIATNVNQPKYKKIDEHLPRILAIGFSYHLNELALFAFDVMKDVQHSVSYRGGIQIEIVKNFTGRIGVTTAPVSYAVGFGYKQSRWEINIAVQKHHILDFSPGMDILFYF